MYDGRRRKKKKKPPEYVHLVKEDEVGCLRTSLVTKTRPAGDDWQQKGLEFNS